MRLYLIVSFLLLSLVGNSQITRQQNFTNNSSSEQSSTYTLKNGNATVMELLVEKDKLGSKMTIPVQNHDNIKVEYYRNNRIVSTENLNGQTGGPLPHDYTYSTEELVYTETVKDAWVWVLVLVAVCVDIEVSHTENSDGTSSTTYSAGIDCDLLRTSGDNNEVDVVLSNGKRLTGITKINIICDGIKMVDGAKLRVNKS